MTIHLGFSLFYCIFLVVCQLLVMKTLRTFMKRSQEIQNQLLKESQDGAMQVQRENPRDLTGPMH